MLKIIWKKKIRYELYTNSYLKGNLVLWDLYNIYSEEFNIGSNGDTTIWLDYTSYIDSAKEYGSCKYLCIPSAPQDCVITEWYNAHVGSSPNVKEQCIINVHNLTNEYLSNVQCRGFLLVFLIINSI